MKLILIGDLHGTFKGIKKQDLKNCDAIVSCGDFCDAKTRVYKMKILFMKKKDPQLKTQWFDLIGKKKAWNLIKNDLKTGKQILNKLDNYNIPVYIIPGNGDYCSKEHGWKKESINYYNKSLIKNLKNVKNCHNKLVKFGKFNIIGYGINSSPEVPQLKEYKKGLTKKELIKRKKEYIKQLRKTTKLFKKSKKFTIFLSHNVPHNTKIDKITWKKSPAYGKHFGSLVTRKIIEKFNKKILFCVGGHMHEHFAKIRLNGVICINSGAGYEGKYVVVDVDGNKIKKIEFVE